MTSVFQDKDANWRVRTRWWVSRVAIYAALIFWAVVCLFPIYWTLTTSFKLAPDVMKGNMVPWWDFTPRWKGWESLGFSPRLIGEVSTVREEFLKRFWNSTNWMTLSENSICSWLAISRILALAWRSGDYFSCKISTISQSRCLSDSVRIWPNRDVTRDAPSRLICSSPRAYAERV